MFGPAIRQIVGDFEKRFEPYAGGYLFRSTPTAAPIRLSEPEMRESVSRFRRGTIGLMIALGLTTAALIVVPVLLFPEWEMTDIELYGGLAMVVATFTLGWWGLWTSPTRQFARRGAAGPSLSKAEARARRLESIRWTHLIFGAVGIVIWIGIQWFDTGTASGEKKFWLSVAVALGALILVQSVRKWRHQSRR